MGGREFLIILDEEGIGPGLEEPVRKAIAQLTAGAGPTDRFGLISLRQGGFDIQASAPAALTDALTKFVGGGSQRETLDDLTCRSKRAFSTLINAYRASSAGRTMVLVSSGLPANPTGVQTMRRVTGDAADSTFSDLCQIRSNEFDELTAAAIASPANLYVVHYATGMANQANVRDAQQGLDNITGAVNGEIIRISGGSETSIGRIMTETSSYYIATLDAAPPAAVRRIDARSTREGTRLLVRPAGRVRGGSTAAAPAPKVSSPRDMIQVATPNSARFPLRATGLVSRVPGKTDMMVMALFEPEDPAAKLNAAIVALYDDKGTLKAQWTAQPKELEVTPVAAAVPVAPGSYRMRVAVTDAAGKAGSTDAQIVVQLKDAGPVKLGWTRHGHRPEVTEAPVQRHRPAGDRLPSALRRDERDEDLGRLRSARDRNRRAARHDRRQHSRDARRARYAHGVGRLRTGAARARRLPDEGDRDGGRQGSGRRHTDAAQSQ